MFWTVENFKSIKKASLDLQEGGLTLLAGANSSGKSSLIQSLLLAAQSSYHHGGLVLNGPLIRLGMAGELVREGSGRPLSFTISDEVTLRNRIESASPNPRRWVRKVQPYSARFECKPRGERELSVSSLTIKDPENEEAGEFVASDNSLRRSDVEIALNALGGLSGSGGDLLHVKSTFCDDFHPRRTFIYLNGLRPAYLVQVLSRDKIIKKYQEIAESKLLIDQSTAKTDKLLLEMQYRNNFDAIWEIGERFSAVVKDRGVDDLNLPNELVEVAQKEYLYPDVWIEFDNATQRKIIEIASLSRADAGEYILIEIGPKGDETEARGYGLLEVALAEELGLSGKLLSSVTKSIMELGERVNYLGPLRDEPRVAWEQWNELTRGLPVGLRGEYCASQLNSNGSRRVSYMGIDGRTVSIDLLSACNFWMDYLEIGESVSALDLGKSGTGLEIEVDGSHRDLTSLGVGVSQALPMIVGLLLAPSGSVFCIEQPELHLHPDVQARMADFLAYSRPDVYCVVETHSDALLTRIRRRVCEGSLDPDLVSLVFVEKEPDGSIYRTIEMDDVGNLTEWPKGFLTGAMEDAQAIVRASLRRARRERTAGRD